MRSLQGGIVCSYRRLARQPRSRILLFVEAMAELLVAKTLLRLLSFDRLAKMLELAARMPVRARSGDRPVAEIRRAIEAAAAFLPGKTVCFPKGIAAHFMCRLRGIETTLLYGARISDDGKLEAHVWIQDHMHGVIGHSVAEKFLVVAEFPRRAVEFRKAEA